MISLLKPNQDVIKQIDIKKIVSLSNCSEDARKVKVTLKKFSVFDKQKTMEFIFQDNKTKFIFYSAFYSIKVT